MHRVFLLTIQPPPFANTMLSVVVMMHLHLLSLLIFVEQFQSQNPIMQRDKQILLFVACFLYLQNKLLLQQLESKMIKLRDLYQADPEIDLN